MEKVQAHHPLADPASGTSRIPAVLMAALAMLALVLAAAIWAWSHYGMTIFFEMIAAGIAACF